MIKKMYNALSYIDYSETEYSKTLDEVFENENDAKEAAHKAPGTLSYVKPVDVHFPD